MDQLTRPCLTLIELVRLKYQHDYVNNVLLKYFCGSRVLLYDSIVEIKL